jgi:hypothetical protein
MPKYVKVINTLYQLNISMNIIHVNWTIIEHRGYLIKFGFLVCLRHNVSQTVMLLFNNIAVEFGCGNYITRAQPECYNDTHPNDKQ